MTPKTERLELRFDPDLIERLDAWRATQSDLPTRSEAIRSFVEEGLARAQAKPPAEAMQFTHPEMLMTWLLTEILRTKEGYEHQDIIRVIQQALYGGHFWGLAWKMNGLLHEHVVDHHKVSVVSDILDMWLFIEKAWSSFGEDDIKKLRKALGPGGHELSFIGFDGHTESEYVGIAQFLTGALDRFPSFKDRNCDSHFPTVSRYRKMADKFNSMRRNLVGRGLSVDEVAELMKILP